jgi:hypothetical protein
MVSSAMLLAGLGSVMLIANQVANAPLASSQRLDASEALNEFSNDLRFATFFHERSAQVLDFVVADRTSDGTAERIRYEWSGVPGESLYKTVNGGAPRELVQGVEDLQLTVATSSKTDAYTTTIESAETLLDSNTSGSGNVERDIAYTAANAGQFSALRLDPTAYSGAPANATSWNLKRVEFQGVRSGGANENFRVQLRSSGDPFYRPTSEVLGEVVIPEGNLTSSTNWNTATFGSPLRELALHRAYDPVWTGTLNEVSNAGRIVYYDIAGNTTRHVNESSDGGTTWVSMPGRRIYYRLYGTYNSPGSTYNVTRTFATHVNMQLQTGDASLSRVNVSVPLLNAPELLSAYWRTDFDRSPTGDDVTRDGTTDWIMANSGTYGGGGGGVWLANGALESRAKNNFTSVTTIEARCRNISQGGKGAVLRINADRQGGNHGPLEIRVQQQADLSQTVSLYGKSDDATDVKLFERKNLSSDFVRLRLTILPTPNVVNLAINDVDEGTYSYSPFAASNDDRFLTFLADTSNAEYDYVELRIAE